MSTSTNRAVAAYSVQSAKASQKYGQLAALPMYQSSMGVLCGVSLAWIPQGATIISATLQLTQGAAVTGSHAVSLFQITQAWNSSVTWATYPTRAGAATATTSKTNPAAGTLWSWDVTALVQSFVTGTARNFGFALAKNEASKIVFNGTNAAAGRPVLIVEYAVLPAVPSNLNPSGGAVSLAKPTLTFDADDFVTSFQVQIDPAMNGTTPAFASGTVTATAGLLDLSTTAYAGLANAASTYWRVRQNNGSGSSGWSAWAPFSRTNKGTVTITIPPSGSIDDGTPPIEWTFSGTQTAWQVLVLDSTGAIIWNSGRKIGTATSTTPTKGFVSDGDTGTIVVRIWDNVDRETTAGDPVWASASKVVTVNLDASTPPVDSLTVDNPDNSPRVRLRGTRANVPDQVHVYVNGKKVRTYNGVDVFSGTNYTIRDMSAPLNVPATYRVAPVVNGKVAQGGPTATYTPTCDGIWIYNDDDTSQSVAIWGNDEQEQTEPELSIVHTPISDGDSVVQVVRRRLVQMPPQGTIQGTIVDVGNKLAADSESTLRKWKAMDAGQIYRLFLGNRRHKCIIGDITFIERPINNKAQRVFDVSFNWWSQS